MFNTLKREEVKFLRERYPEGTRIKLLHMDDTQAPPIGTLGTVTNVDDIGTIHVSWYNGSSLGVCYGEDRVQVVSK